MDSKCYANSMVSSGHFPSDTSTLFSGAGNHMLPSPECGARELFLHQQQQGAMFYPTQISSSTNLGINSGNPIKQEAFPQNPQCFNNSELGVVIIPEAQKFHDSPPEISYPPTPTTPHNEKYLTGFPMTTSTTNLNFGPIMVNNSETIITLPQQAEMFYEQGHHLLHIVKPRNAPLAFSYFDAAASLGSKRGKHQLAYCLQHGIGVVKDEKKAVEIYLEIADADPPNAATLCQLGICFQMGIGVEADASRAVLYYERAVLLGHIDAMFNLAYCLRNGIGTPINYERAYELYYRMSELGDPQAMKFLGNCKSIGLGTVKDEREALEWFRRSSESDIYWGGKLQYALYLLKGIGTIPNQVEAFNLIRTVCENFPSCPGPNKVLLGRFYHFGIGCQIDLEKALYWYERALRSYHMQHSVQECQMLINNIQQRLRF